MSRGVNKVILLGNLGNDPDIRYTPSGDAVANFQIATSESWKDKATGEKKESTEWHKIVIFRKQAELAKEYLRKGSKVYIEGQLKTRKWKDKSGGEHYTTEVICANFQMLDGKDKGDGNHSSHDDYQPQPGSLDDESIPF